MSMTDERVIIQLGLIGAGSSHGKLVQLTVNSVSYTSLRL